MCPLEEARCDMDNYVVVVIFDKFPPILLVGCLHHGNIPIPGADDPISPWTHAGGLPGRSKILPLT